MKYWNFDSIIEIWTSKKLFCWPELLTLKKRKKSKVDKYKKTACVIMFDCQTAKISTNAHFAIVTRLLKLCKATCCATHCGSSDTSANASQNWSTKVSANKLATIQALDGPSLHHWNQTYLNAKQRLKISSKERKYPSKEEEDIYLMCCFIHNSHMSTLWLNQNFVYFLKNVFYLKFTFFAHYISMMACLQDDLGQ